MSQFPTFILYPDPTLRAAAAIRPVDAALRATGSALLSAAESHRVYGLAAAHIGQVEPVIVISVAPPEARDYRVLYNPRIVETGGSLVSGTEGSVSLPGIEVEISRPDHASVAYDDADGAPRTRSLEGFAARVALHETEQVNGIFFLTHLSRLKRDAALRRFQKLSRDQK
jgi:peptide deformylase